MDKKLTIIELAEQVAAKAQTTNRMGELFLKELFATVAQELIEGHNVEIKSLGNFVLSEGNGADEPNVDFTPAQAVAEAVTQPFAQFTPLELSDDITPEQLQLLEEVEPEPETPVLDEESVTEAPVSASEPEPEEEVAPVSEPEVKAEETALPAAALSETSEPSESSESSEHSEVSEPTEPQAPSLNEADVRKVAKSSLLKGIVVGALGALLLTTLLWILFGPKGVFTGSETNKTETVTADTAGTQLATPSIFKASKPQPVEPKKEIPVIRDTVTAKRPLTVIARHHYGNEFFYVYIYEENKDHIKDVNNIAPGTEVIIPLASKYGFDPKDSESIKQAQLKSMELNKGH